MFTQFKRDCQFTTTGLVVLKVFSPINEKRLCKYMHGNIASTAHVCLYSRSLSYIFGKRSGKVKLQSEKRVLTL